MIDCAQVQAALSARLDGEEPGVADDVVDAHVSGCLACQGFVERAAQLNRRLKFSPAADPAGDAPPPDLSGLILAGVEPVRRRQAASRALALAFSRVALVLVGVVLVVWAFRLVAASAQEETPALFIEAAAIRLALACGLIFAAWRPQVSVALLPVYGAFAAFRCGFATREVILGIASFKDLVGLAVLVAAPIVLLCTWIAGLGGSLRFAQLWRSLTAQPY